MFLNQLQQIINEKSTLRKRNYTNFVTRVLVNNKKVKQLIRFDGGCVSAVSEYLVHGRLRQVETNCAAQNSPEPVLQFLGFFALSHGFTFLGRRALVRLYVFWQGTLARRRQGISGGCLGHFALALTKILTKKLQTKPNRKLINCQNILVKLCYPIIYIVSLSLQD